MKNKGKKSYKLNLKDIKQHLVIIIMKNLKIIKNKVKKFLIHKENTKKKWKVEKIVNHLLKNPKKNKQLLRNYN